MDMRSTDAAQAILRTALRRGMRIEWSVSSVRVIWPQGFEASFRKTRAEGMAAVDMLLATDDADACFAVLRGLYPDPGDLENEGKR